MRLASVHRNDVPAVVAFHTLTEAKRARAILWERTWAYDAWGEMLIMMPLKKMVPPPEEGCNLSILRTTPHALLRRGMNKFGVDVCEVDDEGVLHVSRSVFIHKSVATKSLTQYLQSTWELV